MIKIEVKFDVKTLVKKLEGDQKQIAFATAVALTKTAQQVQAEEYQEIKAVFDRPTEYTLNSLYVKPATKQSLEARVWVKDDVYKGTPAEKYLLPEIIGGTRRAKRFERALMNAGLMPQGYYAMPGIGAPLDAYGNIPSKFIVQLLSYLKAFGGQGYKANITDKGKIKHDKSLSKKLGASGASYFVNLKKGKLPLGIYQRISYGFGKAIKPVIIYVKFTQYKPLFKFKDVADRAINKSFEKYLKESVEYAFNTRR